MIPLSRWLSEQDGKICALPDLAPDIENPPDLQSSLDAAFEQGRRAGMASAEVSLEAALHAERQRFSQREQEIVTEWQVRCGEHITENIEAVFLELRSGIEAALTAVLQPFIEDAVRVRAIDKLFIMLDEELVAGTETCLEINAPPDLHADFSVRLAAMGINPKLTAGNTMNVTARLGSVTFESMAGLWIDTLRGARR